MFNKLAFFNFFILSLLIFNGCNYPSADSPIYRDNIVINNSNYDVTLSCSKGTFTIAQGTTEKVSIKMARNNTNFIYLVINDENYPRVNMSKKINGYLTCEYTITDSEPKSYKITNLSGYDVQIYDNYLGQDYNKDGLKITKDTSQNLDFYNTPAINAFYLNNGNYPDGKPAVIEYYEDGYIIK